MTGFTRSELPDQDVIGSRLVREGCLVINHCPLGICAENLGAPRVECVSYIIMSPSVNLLDIKHS